MWIICRYICAHRQTEKPCADFPVTFLFTSFHTIPKYSVSTEVDFSESSGASAEARVKKSTDNYCSFINVDTQEQNKGLHPILVQTVADIWKSMDLAALVTKSHLFLLVYFIWN